MAASATCCLPGELSQVRRLQHRVPSALTGKVRSRRAVGGPSPVLRGQRKLPNEEAFMLHAEGNVGTI